MKLLIDECLSPALVALARDRGLHGSTHVTWLGLVSRKDWTIVGRAIEDGFVLVTNDAVDFRALYGREKIHPGLVCLNVAPGMMSLARQKQLFLLALERLAGTDPVNEVLEITLTVEGRVLVHHYALPSD